jgi:hypothetical protein
MRLPKLVYIALGVAIAIGIFILSIYPTYILELGLAPNGITLREFYQARSVNDLPVSIQKLMIYQYPFAILGAVAGFGTIYFTVSQAERSRWMSGLGCFLPIAIFIFFPLLLIAPIFILFMAIRLIWYREKLNRSTLVSCLYSLILNIVFVLLAGFHLGHVLSIIS